MALRAQGAACSIESRMQCALRWECWTRNATQRPSVSELAAHPWVQPYVKKLEEDRDTLESMGGVQREMSTLGGPMRCRHWVYLYEVCSDMVVLLESTHVSCAQAGGGGGVSCQDSCAFL
eukprot:scaffold40133_cov21-Tisochrysis_lutea.AAC.3